MRASALVTRADALESVARLDGRVDVTITDTPYSSETYARIGRERRNDGSVPRDRVQRSLSPEYIDQLGRALARATRRWVLLFTDEYDYPRWRQAIVDGGGRYVRQGLWAKTNPMPQMTGDRPSQAHELILIAHGGSRGKMRWRGGGLPAMWTGPTSGPVRAGNRHVNAKPDWLMDALVRLFTEPGELVFDPFCGSGSTGVAAAKAGRRVVMSDDDSAWVSHARARVLSQHRQLTLEV